MNKTVNLDDLIGVPYKEGGTDKNGFYCYGYAAEVCRRFGKELPDIDGAKDPDRDFMLCLNKGLQKTELKQIDRPVREGDIILFKNPAGMLNHVGIYLGDGLFTHCDSHGVHIEKLCRKEHFIGRCYTWL